MKPRSPKFTRTDTLVPITARFRAYRSLWPIASNFRSKDMRAEAQDHIDKIGAALALLRRFLDWDRAVRRLDELNAKVEDPALWNDAKAAQEVMRESRRQIGRAPVCTPVTNAHLVSRLPLEKK